MKKLLLILLLLYSFDCFSQIQKEANKSTMLKYKRIGDKLFISYSPYVNSDILVFVSVAGNDSNNGLSENYPIQTVSKLNSIDPLPKVAYFRRGDMFEGDVNSLIQINTYGEGDDPIIFNSGSYACTTESYYISEEDSNKILIIE